jgi:tRNA (guanine-N7-)-methyltransferase
MALRESREETDGMAVVRVREHVNPLSRRYRQPAALPDWAQVYAQPQRPLHVDIGCARGKFLLELAPQRPDWNFLGIEIREPLVHQANEWRDDLALTNLHFLFGNINYSIQPLLASLPAGIIQMVSIQFPDPWFKKRHQKRRVVQPELVRDLAAVMPVGSQVFLQSDVEEVAAEMRDRFAECLAADPAFAIAHPETLWLPENPLPVRTEREQSTLSRGEPVYRALFRRT